MEDFTVILTKEEIGDAIINYIGIFKRNMVFHPFHILETDQELYIPETVMFTTRYVPMGSKKVNHNI